MNLLRDQVLRFLADDSAHSPVEWMILGLVSLGALVAAVTHVGILGMCIAWDIAG